MDLYSNGSGSSYFFPDVYKQKISVPDPQDFEPPGSGIFFLSLIYYRYRTFASVFQGTVTCHLRDCLTRWIWLLMICLVSSRPLLPIGWRIVQILRKAGGKQPI